MICSCCFAQLASEAVFCPHCGERVQPESEWQPTRLLAQDRGTTALNTDHNGTSVLLDEQALEVVRWLTSKKGSQPE
jgi:hypothetical protein